MFDVILKQDLTPLVVFVPKDVALTWLDRGDCSVTSACADTPPIVIECGASAPRLFMSTSIFGITKGCGWRKELEKVGFG
jgi:hypothetical protein